MRLFGSELEQRADRIARAAPGARLEVAAEEDQRRDHCCDLEVRVGVETADEHDGRPQVGRESADGDQRVHRRRAVACALQRRAMEVDSAPEDDGRRERKRDPFPARELKRRNHGQGSERRCESDRDIQTTPKRGDGLVVVVMPARLVDRMRVIPAASTADTRSSTATDGSQ